MDAAWPQDSLEERLLDQESLQEIYQGIHALEEPIRRFFSSAFWGALLRTNRCALSQDGKLGPGDLLPGKRKNQGGIAMNVPCG